MRDPARLPRSRMKSAVALVPPMLLQRVTNAITATKVRRPSRLRVLHDSGRGSTEEIPLPAAGVVLGAAPTCDVVLDDPAVSRKHVSVVPCEAGFDVNDLGSRNGTWLDGAKISRATVPPGSTLRIGSSLVQMLPAEEPVDIPPSTKTSFGAMLGSSDAMRRVFAVLERASISDAAVLLLGESGTGKELAARAVHEASRREGRALRRLRLRSCQRVARREHAVRPQARRLHRRACRSPRRVRARTRRHALPRRDRRPAARDAAEAAPHARARRNHAARRPQERDLRRALRRGDAPRSPRRGRARSRSARTSTTGSRWSRFFSLRSGTGGATSRRSSARCCGRTRPLAVPRETTRSPGRRSTA